MIPKGVVLADSNPHSLCSCGFFVFSGELKASFRSPENTKTRHFHAGFESAVRGGFEPPVQFPVRQFSKLLVSATHPPHQVDDPNMPFSKHSKSIKRMHKSKIKTKKSQMLSAAVSHRLVKGFDVVACYVGRHSSAT
jgi:hypothetical protein